MAAPPALPWASVEGGVGEDGECRAEEEDFGFTDIEEDLALFGSDELIAEAIRNGDLRRYVADIEGDLRKVERDSIADYVHESENLAQLHRKIRGCDQLLEGMETVLGGFQTDLGRVSEEIKGLQQQASELSVKGRNRRAVNHRLTSVVDAVAVSPSLIHTITEAEVNEAFIEHLLHLQRKLAAADSALAQSVASSGNVQLAPVLSDLKVCPAHAQRTPSPTPSPTPTPTPTHARTHTHTHTRAGKGGGQGARFSAAKNLRAATPEDQLPDPPAERPPSLQALAFFPAAALSACLRRGARGVRGDDGGDIQRAISGAVPAHVSLPSRRGSAPRRHLSLPAPVP